MNEREAFLADVREHPDDDAPRLIFADWLDDRGESDRAAFIRAQCAGDATAVRTFAHRLREWAGPVAHWCESWEFHRGFIEMIQVNAQTLIENADRLFEFTPIRYVWTSYFYSEHVRSLTAMPWLARLAVLKIPGAYRHAGFQALCSSPHLEHLAGLNVNDTPIGLHGLVAWISSPSLSRLTHLALGSTGIGTMGVQLLADTPKVENLVSLEMRGNSLDVESLRSLNGSQWLRNLRRLGLWYNRLGDNGLAEFIQMPLFSRLVHLSLGNNRITSRGLQLLAESPALQNLRTLWLGVDRFNDESVERLVRSPYLHPEARIGFWLNENLSEQVKQTARGLLGDRVHFDDPGPTWEADPPVGWPLWQP